MTKSLLLIFGSGLIAFSGCASSGINFEPEVLAQVKEYGRQNSVRVIVNNGDMTMYCDMPDVSNEIQCTVGYGYLYRNVHADWDHLNAPDARKICREGFWMMGSMNSNPYAPSSMGGDEIQLCAYALLQIRFMHLPPDKTPKEWQ